MAPIDLFNRLRAYYSKDAAIKPPAISSFAAALLSVAYTVIYVIPFYLSKSTRPSPCLSRDAPSVIRARIRAVTSACVVCTLLSIYVITEYDADADALETLRLLGWWPIPLVAISKTVLLCMMLFIGPLFEAAIVKGRLGSWLRGTHLRETFASWTGWRNLVAGPITEELVFRSLIIPLHLMAHMSPSRIVFLTPLYFGIAHIHHFYEFVLTHPDFPMLPAVIRTLVQFTYTSVFGFFAAFVFLRTGSLYAAIAAHSFCNWMGLPRFWGRVRRDEHSPAGQADDAKMARPRREAAGASNKTSQASKGTDLSIVWTIAYYALLVAGAIGFQQSLMPLTESTSGLADFSTSQRGK